MEANARWVALTAVAPVAWGANYFVTREFLPVDRPLYGAALRALPAGLALLAFRRRRPHGPWWWRSAILGVVNVSLFFVLVYASSQLLPTSVASTVMAVSPLTMMFIAWPLVAERPRAAHLAGGAVGLVGVCLMLLTGGGATGVPGILAAAAAVLVSSFGHILAKRWSGDADMIATTAWQLTAGGLFLLPVAVVAEGTPPALSSPTLLAFCYVGLVATALAFTAWFTGLRHLPAGTVGLIGLLNPVTGVLFGTVLAGEVLTVQQLCGLALVLAGVTLGRPTRAGRRAGDQASDHLESGPGANSRASSDLGAPTAAGARHCPAPVSCMPPLPGTTRGAHEVPPVTAERERLAPGVGGPDGGS